jgi:hypothetical protein
MASNQPLLLLLEHDADRAVQQVSKFIAHDDLVHIYDDSSATGPVWRVIYKALTFRLEVTQIPNDVAGYDRVFCSVEPASSMSMLAFDLDANLARGQKTAPIAAALLEIGAYFSARLGPSVIAWRPAKIASDPVYFREAVSDYVNGGAFPALAVIGFDFSCDDRVLRTTGLDWFSGQELELTGNGLSKADLARRAVRLIHDIAVNGPMGGGDLVPDIASDGHITLSLSEDGAVVVGEICSDMDLVKHR